MTRTARFTHHAQVVRTPMGPQPSSLSSRVQAARHALQVLGRVLLVALDAGGSTSQREADQPYPWLPSRIRRSMGARARRLMRAGY